MKKGNQRNDKKVPVRCPLINPGQTAIVSNISWHCRWWRWVKGFTFSKGETFLVTGGFRWDSVKNGDQFIIAPSPSLPPPAGGEWCRSSGVRGLKR